MSDQNHYETLGVDESASFEEIQATKERLVQELAGDRKQIEAIEAAYDAILMDRLRMRQEGKIKVPDRIRFPEKSVEPLPALTPPQAKASPGWLQRLIDTPSTTDILLPAGLFLATSVLSLSSPPAALALGIGFSLYFLTRKERKFGRSLLLTLIGFLVGTVIGLQMGALLETQLQAISLSTESFAALLTFLALWLISSFLK